MTDSATSPAGPAQGTQRAREITRAAQELVAERGWTHVTIDDIAARVGISRRTFFNHVDSKESAVLGTLPRLTADVVAHLAAEPEDDDLIGHIVRTVAASIEAVGTKVEDWRRLHDVLVANPDLIPRFKDRVEALFAEVVAHLAARPDADVERARVALTAATALFQVSVEDAVDRPELGPFAERLSTNLALLRDLAAPRRS